MYKCAFCEKEIGVKADHSGQLVPNTKYWHGQMHQNLLFCDAKCSLDAYETWSEEWYVLKRGE